MNLLQHLDHPPHVLRILYIASLHLLDILRDRHVGALEDIYCKVQILQGQLVRQSLVIHELLYLFLI